MNAPETTSNVSSTAANSGPDARERILSAAETLFAVRGFEGVSTTQIAKVAGITQPLIHYHFKNKEALWKATVTQLFGRMLQGFSADIQALNHDDDRRRMVEMIRCYVSYVARYPQFGQFILREGVQASPRLDWMVEEWLKPMLNPFRELYGKGVTQGWLRDIPFPQMIMIVTASASHFFSMAPLVNSLYDIDATSPEQVLAHSDAVVDVSINALLLNPQAQSYGAVTA